VAPEIIVAILGVETFYGSNTGSHRVLDALYTLGFHYPKRADFFRRELEEMLLLTREEGSDPRALTGSYAGAMGKPQFISSSFRAYAVDFDADGQRDIWNNDADAIGSVASYFARHGWQSGAGIADRIQGEHAGLAELAAAGMKPSHRAADLRARGIPVDAEIGDDDLLSVIELETERGPEYWLGRNNFYVITRYNRSNLYAMAVFQLSEAIRHKARTAR
jgi:membrane-bound lytic murein transglycosylase B